MVARPYLRALFLASAATVLASAASAQCPGPDNLTGPCWQPTSANLPPFPGVFVESAGLCWIDCSPLPKEGAIVQMSPPSPLRCAEFGSQVTVTDFGGANVLSGFATLNYTRTWNETNPVTLQSWQVWRMLFKVDFSETFGAPPVCYNPPCLNTTADRCFWYGYVDWAQDCSTGAFENAFAMYHSCDDFVHNSLFSSDPAPAGGYHPFRYYAIVGPDTPPNPFVPAVLPPRGGPLFTEAVRNVESINPPGLCVNEERMSGSYSPLGQACLCPVALGSLGQSANTFAGAGTCVDATGVPSSFFSLNLFNLSFGLKWFELMATSLGRWTSGASYPGPEGVFAEEGFFLYHDSCAATFGLPADTLDMMYGSKTVGGFLANDIFGVTIPDNFVDLGSNYSQPFVSLPLVGNAMQTDHLIYGNF